MKDGVANWPLILEYLKALTTWPVVTVIVLAIFRRPLRVVIDTLNEKLKALTGVKGGKWEAGFQPPPQAAVPPEAPPVEHAQIVRIVQHEHFLNLVYGSQIDFLRVLRSKEGGATLGDRDNYFAIHRQRFPNTTLASPEQWMQFLLQYDMVQVNGQGVDARIRLTPRGTDFFLFADQVFPQGLPPRFA